LFTPGEVVVTLMARSRHHRAWYLSTDCKYPGSSQGFLVTDKHYRSEFDVTLWVDEDTIVYDTKTGEHLPHEKPVEIYAMVDLNLPPSRWWTRKRKGDWFVITAQDKWGVFVSAVRTKSI
jgi:hypothetical protein